MEANEPKTPDVYRAIRDVTKALSKDGITKDKKNEQQGYKFRGIDDVYNALSAVLAGADLCILPKMNSRTVEERATKSGGVLFYVTVEADFHLISARDGSRDIVTFFGEAMDSGDKATNKAMSAAYKYCCMQTFCIPTESMMEDADQQTHEPTPKAVSPKVAPVVQKPPVAPQPQMTMADTVRFTAETWLKKFIALNPSRPDEFKRILGIMGYQEISQIPADHAKAKTVFDELKAVYATLPGKPKN